ncbi:MAG TPA: NRDE family protein [Burkholderiaceae bacterium]|nr:NRDE family protein [Burkholderiaceae bacterium]
MCLIVFAWQAHPDYPLVLAGNRDEFYTRRARPAAWWGQAVSLLAGQDEEAGGTWFGITRRGRIAALTNVRAPTERNPHAPSRGALVLAALQTPEPVDRWLHRHANRTPVFNGFNLLAGDIMPTQSRPAGALHYYSNRLDAPARALAPGVYGLSNAFLDTPWPKVTRSVAQFACSIASRVKVEDLLALMSDRELARDTELPSTGVPIDWERALSAIQIRANGYGTRATTVLTVRADGLVSFFERTFDTVDPAQSSDRHFEFMIDTASRPARMKAPPN